MLDGEPARGTDADPIAIIQIVLTTIDDTLETLSLACNRTAFLTLTGLRAAARRARTQLDAMASAAAASTDSTASTAAAADPLCSTGCFGVRFGVARSSQRIPASRYRVHRQSPLFPRRSR